MKLRKLIVYKHKDTNYEPHVQFAFLGYFDRSTIFIHLRCMRI